MPRLIVLLAVIALVVYLVYVALRRPARPAGPSRWETHTEAGGGMTVVVVRRVSEGPRGQIETGRQIIAEIPDNAPDWETLYHQAMSQARTRVSTLEIESD